jgi:hypothetical protein
MNADETSVVRVVATLIVAQVVVAAAQLFVWPAGIPVFVEVPFLLAALALCLRFEAHSGIAVRDALALRQPLSSRAWLVAALPALTILFAHLLSGGFTYTVSLPAILIVAVVSEIVFRGFAFQRLRRGGDTFMNAALVAGALGLIPQFIHIRHPFDLIPIAGVLAQSVWLAWLVERWKSVWIAAVSVLLLIVGLNGLSMFMDGTGVWLRLGVRLWIIGMSVALTQTLQRRPPSMFGAP